MEYIEKLYEGLNIAQKEHDQRVALSCLLQNAVSAMDIDTRFFMVDKDDPLKLDLPRREAWYAAYRIVLRLTDQGDYDSLISLAEEEGKEYPFDPYNPVSKSALIYCAKFFTVVYTTWLQEQEAARIVPVAKYLEKIATPEPPYYHSWIQSYSQDKAWEKALQAITKLVDVLDENSFFILCLQLTDQNDIMPQEAKAIKYMAKKYLDFHRLRLDEKKKAVGLALKILPE